MDHEAVHADYVYRQYPLVAPDPLTVIAFSVQLLQLFATLIAKLTSHLKRCKKDQCQDLQELLESMRPDVTTSAEAVESCKRLGITTTPQESWLDRLRIELLQMEKLIDKCASRGLFDKLRGAGLSQKISAKLETLKRLASELPQMHGVLTNLRMTAEVHGAAVGSRCMPSSFGNQRNPEFVQADRIRYETRPYHSYGRMPSFEYYRNHDAEFVSDRCGYESRPYYWSHRMPSSGDYRNCDAELVCVDGVYFPKARCELIFLEQPIAFKSYASFGRVPVMNPHYMKHIESEYY